MSRIILGSHIFHYPIGGVLSWVLQNLMGLKKNGHDVIYVEKSTSPNSCFNPLSGEMSNDCSYGIMIVAKLMERFEMQDNFCFVDADGNYHGLTRKKIEAAFSSADLFINMGSNEGWTEESTAAALRVFIDVEPAYTQIKWKKNLEKGIPIPVYDRYFTNGKNVGLAGNPVPTLDLQWEHIYSPVDTSLFSKRPPDPMAPYSTIMNWQAHEAIEYGGKVFGQKDLEFEKFITLPNKVTAEMEVGVSGSEVPIELLNHNNWTVRNAQQLTITYEAFINYIEYCRGEFSVCKNISVENNTGWFSDKSAAYLASWRPVIIQDTGFSTHLPVGEGIVPIKSLNEAVDAIDLVESNYEKHAKAAREIACEFLDATKTMKKFLNRLGL